MIKLSFFTIVTVGLLFFNSCRKEDEITAPDPEPDYHSLFTDKLYEKGFSLSSVDEGNGNTVGTLNYNGKATGSPVWKIGQWNCINNNLANATYSFVDNRHEYRVGTEGNRIAVDTKTGTLTLELNSSTEYGKNGITSNPRKQNEPWPALLCEYSLSESQILKVAGKKEIHMIVDYKVTKTEDKTPRGRINPNLHAAQFQWFITIQNRNKTSEDFGHYIWFGFDFFDTRYDFTPAYFAQDGGKENNTGAFIYMPDMKPLMVNLGKAEVNKMFEVDIDVLPVIRDAFALAQERHYLTKSTWEELYIGASNIGWETPGTYDVAVDIFRFDIKYR
jgi:hypothetical protein